MNHIIGLSLFVNSLSPANFMSLFDRSENLYQNPSQDNILGSCYKSKEDDVSTSLLSIVKQAHKHPLGNIRPLAIHETQL